MSSPKREDVILPMTDDYMQQIVSGAKNYEFRKYRIAPSVRRIWFYLNAPRSHIAYICEIEPARTRVKGDEKLVEDGLGNKEFNERHPDWSGYDYAYRILSVYEIRTAISLKTLKADYGIKGAPRGLVYAPPQLIAAVVWREQKRILPVQSGPVVATQSSQLQGGTSPKSTRKKSCSEESDPSPSTKKVKRT